MSRPDGITLSAMAGIILLAGSNFVAVKFSNEELAPVFGAALRFAAASAILLVVIRVRRISFPRGRALTGALLYGVLGFFAAFALLYLALVRLPAGITSVSMALVPLLTLFLAYLHRLEPFRWRGLLGAAITVAGVAVLVNAPVGTKLHLVSLAAALLAAVGAAESGIVIKKFPPTHPMATNAVAMSTGAILLLPTSALLGEEWAVPTAAKTWWSLAYLVLLGSLVMFALYLFVLRRWTASGASYQFVLFPLVTVLVAAWLAGEQITYGVIIGGLVVLAGVYVGAISRQPPPAREEALPQQCS